MTDNEPRSPDAIKAELERVETLYSDLNAELEEDYRDDGYLKGLRYALNEFTPDDIDYPSPETVDAVVADAEEEFPDAHRIFVERRVTPPKFEHVSVQVIVGMDYYEDSDEWMEQTDRLSEIARKHEDEDEFVCTLLKRESVTE